jgi:hypothetical protein
MPLAETSASNVSTKKRACASRLLEKLRTENWELLLY